MPKSKEPNVNPQLLIRNLAESLRQQAYKPNIHAYEPHKKQLPFHQSTKPGRLYIGGNRSGKTTAAVVEDLYWARGQHPHRPVPEPPIRGRVVGVDFLDGVQKILLPEFRRWTPPSMLKNGSWDDSYNKELRTLTFENGSFVEFMSYDQETQKFAGTSRHFIHYDEEPPQHVFNECSARLIDTDGSWWMSMTPVEGMTWIYDNIYLPGTLGLKDIKVIEVDMLDNPHISPEAAERILQNYDEDERKAREHGTFVQLGGLIYKKFNKNIHVIPATIPPNDWEHYASLDHGFNNPTAWLWHAVSPNGDVITYAEHYKSELTVDQHASIVHARNAGLGRVPDVYVGDPSIAQRQGVTGTSIQMEYMDRGIPIMPGNNDVVVGINRVNNYLRTNPVTGNPYWQITENCVNLINEMQRYRWKTWASKKSKFENNAHDAPHKKDDHAVDSARYFFTVLPDLTPQEQTEHREINLVPATNVTGRYDEVLAKMKVPDNDWQVFEGTDTYALESD